MFARSQSSHSSNRLRLAIIIGCLGALLAGYGVFRMQHGTEDSWQPLNDNLNALLSDESVSNASSESKASSGDAASVQQSAKTAPSPTSTTAPQAIANIEPVTETQASANSSSIETVQSTSDAVGADSAVASTDGRIDINHATAQQLDELPGIGPAKAAAIVADREANGPFRSVDDLDRVKGIGLKMIEKLRASVVALP
ncbi:hypothetical protein PCCS19_44270 [Paenibacillus sp. CCS19]|uniref:ComEA family DNA-binding protein n=1 Tax=Paenibacillus sp. CCS19 TaxID=3158387 RepID=UPI00256CEA5A|nr:ComEA family DNA-binding protein [Paenibacillus cellulosilyticus]GMK41371.1 hypothetical protein PCCS19_44270 [Paenibacillus cellulosilyticus]